MDIAKRMIAEREYQLSQEAEWKLKDYLMTVKSTTSPIKFSNGRFVRNVIEKSIRAQAMRLLMGDQYLKNDLMTIKSQDLLIKDEAVPRIDLSAGLRGLFFISLFKTRRMCGIRPAGLV